jgi:phage baseplate assembly protein W
MAEDFTDFDCFDDLNAFDVDITDPIEVLAQDVYHILIEPAGSNIDDPDRGIGLPDHLSAPRDATLAARIDAQLQKDDRVDTSSTTIEDNGTEQRVDIRIEVAGTVVDLAFVNDADGFRRAS